MKTFTTTNAAVAAAYAECLKARKARRNNLIATVLTAPFHALAWTLTATAELLGSINWLFVLVCLLGNDE